VTFNESCEWPSLSASPVNHLGASFADYGAAICTQNEKVCEDEDEDEDLDEIHLAAAIGANGIGEEPLVLVGQPPSQLSLSCMVGSGPSSNGGVGSGPSSVAPSDQQPLLVAKGLEDLWCVFCKCL
jgi:hypothetical protein